MSPSHALQANLWCSCIGAVILERLHGIRHAFPVAGLRGLAGVEEEVAFGVGSGQLVRFEKAKESHEANEP